MKKYLLIVLCVLMASTMVMGAAKKPVVADTFSEGGLYVTPQIGLNSYTIPFGVNVEYGITPNIGIGGTAMYWHWSDVDFGFTVIALEVEAAYHFTDLKVDKLDVYAGLGVGYDIFSSSITGFTQAYGSGVSVDPFVAGRYYFSDTIAAQLKLHFAATGNFSGVGFTAGVTFKLS